ncbi:hypothetical protein [Methylophaga sp. OBS4]|uniref:hypothetical protein n=1 Tax=Methylophaga sp. OBS4 TaxID=2991935 RepID=UPI00224D3ED4|nr:hypothetical protein [Methylophaga sp. OBS4]MCX4187089.1 hypothetical protein [Methylophaga sp. OBS4]
MSELIVFMLAIVFSFALWWLYKQHHRQVIQSRASLLDSCGKVMTVSETRFNAAGYASIRGFFNQTPLSLRVEVDNLTARKIPVMWLHIKLERNTSATTGSLDILVRPQNTEFYSPSWQWSQPVKPLAGWPEHARYMSRDVTPDLQAIDADVRTLFADEKTKELLITPDAVRLTYLIRQADRGNYLLLRSVHFDDNPIDSDQVAALARQLQRLQYNLDGGENP